MSESTTAPKPDKSAEKSGLGSFNGVFRPTVLTILGVMMYLREGWLVGQAGLVGAVLVILTTFLITGATALSLSTITTNIRLGAGGAFAVIAQSLGLEAGGAIGIPLYLAQALSGALYIYGFAETWLTIFPSHPMWAVILSVFALAYLTAFISTKLAFRLQGVVMIAVLVSLGSIAFGLTSVAEPTYHNPQLWGEFESGGFWTLFAIFFPAGTGIMVGASMSGTLDSPRRSIPRGTLAAVGVALFVYLFMAVWYSVLADPEALRADTLIVIKKAAWGKLVIAGILASTFTATLSSFVAAPNILQALGQYGVLPKGDFFAKMSDRGEPRVASLVTGALVLAALSLGSLNRVASLITMFFLLTYFTINVVVLIEQKLGMVSFRPLFRIPLVVPVIGTIACAIAVFVISPTFALVAISVVVAVYAYLVKKQLEQPWETVRSAMFVAMADWAAKRIVGSQESNERSWKPNLLIPVESRAQLDGHFRILSALTKPKGSLQIVGIRYNDTTDGPPDDEHLTEQSATVAAGSAKPGPPPQPGPPPKPGSAKPGSAKSTLVGPPSTAVLPKADARFESMDNIASDFQDEGLFATSIIIEADTLLKGVDMSASVMRGNFFRPNVLFGMAHHYDQETTQGLIDIADHNDMGVAFLYRHPEASLGHERTINVWIRDQSPDWSLGLRLANLDLSLLMAYQICRNWNGKIRFLVICDDPDDVDQAEDYLQQLIEDARLTRYGKTWVRSGNFVDQLRRAPRADLNIFGLAREVDLEFLRKLVTETQHSCLFVRDSGNESALA
jgi:amino acid transporter